MRYSVPFSKAVLIRNLSIAWPMAFNAVLMQSVPLIDLLMVSALGEIPIAALGIAGAIMSFIIGVQFAIANATQLVLARAMGEENKVKLGTELAAGWINNLAFSLVALIVLSFSMDFLVHLITHNDHVAKEAISYIRVALGILLFSSISQVIVVYFNASKSTRIPLYGLMMEVPINVVCSYVFIYGFAAIPALGIAGAALGSLIAIIIRFSYLVYHFYRETIREAISGFRLVTRAAVIIHMQEVIPMVTNFVVLLIGEMLFQILFAQLSVSAYAAITLVIPWIAIGSIFVAAWSQASAIIASQYLGKKDTASIPNFVDQSLFVARAMSVIMALGFLGLSLLLPYFYPNLSAETLHALMLIAPIYILLPIVRNNNTYCGNLIRALGDSYINVRINLITRIFIALPVCFILVYIGAPLYLVYGVVLFDEIMKFPFFRKTLLRRVNSYR